MFKEFFEKYPDFIISEKPSFELIKEYSDILPDEMMSFWEKYGFGTFMSGYIRMINPNDYKELFSNSYQDAEIETPFAVIAFGDIISWRGEAINMVCYRYNYSAIIGADEFDWFMNMDLTSNLFKTEDLKSQQFEKAKDRLGKLTINQSYGYFPLLALGGNEKIENLQIVDTKIHIDIITQAVGLVE
ncbi:T6SS immunity protein Tdi1 domain-containing protein [Tenacibaculum agarivorans]|uniref:T6SS immunity protein Tdi1 domain-containing protein n=1 Tax=Tenacibaculum agarivorans TaxID=1908389 RepID=UPI00094B89C9|nr:T6SS immunity protein Tdi1 domain-containing protein [Tenacibaculum agarivorans]